jgi:hypothetical protein
VPDELKHGEVDGHPEGLPSELGGEAQVGLGLVLDMDVGTVRIRRRPEAGTTEPSPDLSRSTPGIRSSFLTWTAVFSGLYASGQMISMAASRQKDISHTGG